MTFGDKLKELRVQAGITQAQLAEVSLVPLGTIRDYEQGNRDPLLSTAQKLALALKQSLDVFPPPSHKVGGRATKPGTTSKQARGKGAGRVQADGKKRKPKRGTDR
jgi:transcriptional regulator with XRE-family HTH domain